MFHGSPFGQSCGSIACRTALAIGLVVALGPRALAQVGADFNGDGFDDLAIGVPYDDEAGFAEAGAVNVLYGSAAGLQATGAGGPSDQLWHQGVTGVDGTPDAGDHFGWALATGDFNNDGYDDLAIGVPHEDSTGAPDVGVVNVLYGSAAGLQSGAGGPLDQLWHQDSAGVLDTAEASDEFGSALVAGDFNNDGFADLAVGVPREDIANNDFGTGAVNVLYGSVAGLQASGQGGPNDQLWQQGIAGVKDTANVADHFGSALAAGDFNNDSYDDLAIGVPGESWGYAPEGGAVNVLYGSAAGLQANGVPDDQYWTQDASGVQDFAEPFDTFGYALAAGDFNGDGEDDLAIGVPYESFQQGAVNVLYGSSTGLQASGVGGPDDQFWNQDAPGVQDVAGGGEFFGKALAAGDFNNDGRDDLAVGVPEESTPGPRGQPDIEEAGAVSLLYGAPTGLQASGVGGPDDQFWHQDVTGVEGTASSEDFFGTAVAAGDFNGDGEDDLAVGVPYEDVRGGADDAGGLNVLYGSPAGVQANGVGGPNDQFWHQGSTGVNGALGSGDLFGQSLP